jgi:hypothetical protein
MTMNEGSGNLDVLLEHRRHGMSLWHTHLPEEKTVISKKCAEVQETPEK